MVGYSYGGARQGSYPCLLTHHHHQLITSGKFLVCATYMVGNLSKKYLRGCLTRLRGYGLTTARSSEGFKPKPAFLDAYFETRFFKEVLQKGCPTLPAMAIFQMCQDAIRPSGSSARGYLTADQCCICRVLPIPFRKFVRVFLVNTARHPHIHLTQGS